jgi:hypothetical protein
MPSISVYLIAELESRSLSAELLHVRIYKSSRMNGLQHNALALEAKSCAAVDQGVIIRVGEIRWLEVPAA